MPTIDKFETESDDDDDDGGGGKSTAAAAAPGPAGDKAPAAAAAPAVKKPKVVYVPPPKADGGLITPEEVLADMQEKTKHDIRTKVEGGEVYVSFHDFSKVLGLSSGASRKRMQDIKAADKEFGKKYIPSLDIGVYKMVLFSSPEPMLPLGNIEKVGSVPDPN
jgi:hypothetical protein